MYDVEPNFAQLLAAAVTASSCRAMAHSFPVTLPEVGK